MKDGNTIEHGEIMTPKFRATDQNNFFGGSTVKPNEKGTGQIWDRKNTKYSDKQEKEVGMQMATDSGFGRNMNKQSTQETGLDSNGGSTIRFGGSFKKQSEGKYKKGNFEDQLYSGIRIKGEIVGSKKASTMEGSNIRVKNVDSDGEADDPMSFLDDLINKNQNSNNLGTMSQHRKAPQMHKDADQELRNYYDENALTVVSEEASTRHTVVLGNNLSKKFSQMGGFPFESDISGTPTNPQIHGPSLFGRAGDFDMSQQSGGKSAISGGSNSGMANSDVVFRMTRTKSALLHPKKPTRSPRKSAGRRGMTKPKSLAEMENILEQSKHEISQESGNLIPQSPIMRVASEGTKQIPKRTFLPDDNGPRQSNVQNAFFGKLQPFRPQIAENSLEESGHTEKKFDSNTNYKNQKIWDHLPQEPKEPNYEISFLSTISNKKAIQKKNAWVENTIFKLSDKGLYYDGGLSYGKLAGVGMLLLKMIDTSDENSEEVRQNLLYKGNFAQNMVNGKGTIFFQNNAKFEGSFVKGIAHGNGKLVTSAGESIYGIWIEGKLNI